MEWDRLKHRIPFLLADQLSQLPKRLATESFENKLLSHQRLHDWTEAARVRPVSGLVPLAKSDWPCVIEQIADRSFPDD